MVRSQTVPDLSEDALSQLNDLPPLDTLEESLQADEIPAEILADLSAEIPVADSLQDFETLPSQEESAQTPTPETTLP